MDTIFTGRSTSLFRQFEGVIMWPFERKVSAFFSFLKPSPGGAYHL